MLTKFVLVFGILALVASVAGTVPAKISTHKVTLTQPAVVLGTTLKAGEYRLNISAGTGAGTVTFTLGKESHTVPVKVETNKISYTTDQVQYDQDGDRIKISEICLGGTKTRLVFN
jgi:hypothetical protein